MARALDQAKITGLAAHFPVAAEQSLARYEKAYDEHRHRVYALAFWMTDSEMAAEEISASVFARAFASDSSPSAEAVDRILLAEIRDLMPIGVLRLNIAPVTEVASVRGNVKRVELERAVVQLPPTERMIFLLHDVEAYDHARIARTLGVSEQESQYGLHQARLRLRQLLAAKA
ncbi:MAG TPA: sigma factor-like helix-turn-helix DNA-binding protein [Terriglobales bacterium]|nr:sigma factor-like helix-turn-helix DNA-binding protein [Terriglobales bacterium]